MRWPGVTVERALPWILYGIAFGARAAFAGAAPYGDEAHHYFVARDFGRPPTNVVHQADIHWLFWWRPLFSLLILPGASISFTAFRIDYMLLVAALAPLLYGWVRRRGARPGYAFGAGLAAALHPFFVVWGVRVFPDELMAASVVAGLLAWEIGRHRFAATLFLAGVWVKEVAVVAVAVILAEESWRSWRAGRAREILRRLDRRHALLLAVLALVWIPHWYAQSIGAPAPGWSRGHTEGYLFEASFLALAAFPLVVAAAFTQAGRRPALIGLAFVAFYLAYQFGVGGAVEQWYLVLPSVMGVAAVALLFEALARRFPLGGAHRRGVALRRTLTGLVAFIVLTQATLAGASPTKRILLHPWSGEPERSVAEAARAEWVRDQDLWQGLATIDGEHRTSLFLADVAWFFVLYPFSDVAHHVDYGYTGSARHGGDLDFWVRAIERDANGTFLRIQGTPLNEAIRIVYAPCTTFTSFDYVVVYGQGCQGRGPLLLEEWGRRQAAR